MMGSAGSVLITGGEGRLAATVAPALARRGWEVFAFGRSVLDITDREEVYDCVRATGATVVLNLAAWTDLDGCERDPDRAERINARAVRHLQEATDALGCHLVHISSDYVFDGVATAPYVESDPASPINVYGASKLLGEAEAGPRSLVVRTSWISGSHGRCLVRSALDAVGDQAVVPRFVNDQYGSPTAADDLVSVLDHVSRERVRGLLHVAGAGVATPYDIARLVFEQAGGDARRIVPISMADRSTARSARRPSYSVLDSGASRRLGVPVLGEWQECLSRLVHRLLSVEAR